MDDRRRITEHDADFVRLKAATVRALTRSVHTLTTDLRATVSATSGGGTAAAGGAETDALSRFITRHRQLMIRAYGVAHREGAKDYFRATSQRCKRTGARVPSSWLPDVDPVKLRKRLAFYAPSIAKMAHQARVAWHQTQLQQSLPSQQSQHTQRAQTVKQFAISEPAPVDRAAVAAQLDQMAQWENSLGLRLTLQADLGWSGMQDGYVDAGASDAGNPYQYLWWTLEPLAQHCDQCPMVAAGSPYEAPGSGGNELAQTPGDGQTECGAGCKCSLEYGASDSADYYVAVDIPAQLPVGAPLTADQQQSLQVLLPAKSPDLTEAQAGALDLYRATWRAWDAARGELPQLPRFAGWNLDQAATRLDALSWGDLTAKQQQLITQAWEAMVTWNSATQAAQAAADAADAARAAQQEQAAQAKAEQAAKSATRALKGAKVSGFTVPDIETAVDWTGFNGTPLPTTPTTTGTTAGRSAVTADAMSTPASSDLASQVDWTGWDTLMGALDQQQQQGGRLNTKAPRAGKGKNTGQNTGGNTGKGGKGK